MSIAIEDIRQRLAPLFRPEAAADVDRVYQFCIGAADAFHVQVADGCFEVRAGPHAEPSVTLFYPDLETALGLLEGRIDPMQAFLAGAIRSDGNLILALQIGLLFRASP